MSDKRAALKQELSERFPEIDPEVRPLGGRVLCQIRSPMSKKGSIILPEDTKETEKWNTQVAKVLSIGPTAFKSKETLEPWPECVVDGEFRPPVMEGDFIRVPRYGGDRWEVGQGDTKALFVIYHDYDVGALITGNPLEMKAFI